MIAEVTRAQRGVRCGVQAEVSRVPIKVKKEIHMRLPVRMEGKTESIKHRGQVTFEKH
jgi:hypothetical protein